MDLKSFGRLLFRSPFTNVGMNIESTTPTTQAAALPLLGVRRIHPTHDKDFEAEEKNTLHTFTTS